MSNLTCFFVLCSFALASAGCGRKNVTYDLTIENPYADVQGVTATLQTEAGPKDVAVTGAKPTVEVILPEIKKTDAMRQLLNVTLHAPLPCGKVDFALDTKWENEADDIAAMEKKQHPKVSAHVPEGAAPKRCEKK